MCKLKCRGARGGSGQVKSNGPESASTDLLRAAGRTARKRYKATENCDVIVNQQGRWASRLEQGLASQRN